MNVREKMLEITKSCKSQTDLDAVIACAGGTIGGLIDAHFVGCQVAEVVYELDNVKMSFKRTKSY